MNLDLEQRSFQGSAGSILSGAFRDDMYDVSAVSKTPVKHLIQLWCYILDKQAGRMKLQKAEGGKTATEFET